MAMVTLTSASKTNVSQTLSFENKNNNLRDASSSSYLNCSEGTFVYKLAESSQNLSPIITNREKQLNLGRKKEEDEEIGVFGAEKYFNGGMDKSPRIDSIGEMKYQYKKQERVDLDPMKPKVQPGTPSARSESSGNSQSALLQSVLRKSPMRKTNKVHGKSFLSGLGCKCICADKNSVDVDEYVGEVSFNRNASCGAVHGKTGTKAHTNSGQDLVDAVQVNNPHSDSWVKEDMPCQKSDKLGVGLNKENCFTFPILNGAGKLPIKVQIEQGDEEKARKSLEVFGSPVLQKRDEFLSLERRLTTLSWNATPGVEEIEISAASVGIYNDNESDASSDLFEIESLTGKANPFLARQGSDGTTSDCVTPTTCYAPSEASIEWSVVTASAADFSVMSDCEEQRSATTIKTPIKTALTSTNAKPRTSKEIERRRPSIQLGCKSHKAVTVAGDAYITSEKVHSESRMHGKSDSLMPVTRFQAEAKLMGFDSRQGQHASATRSIPRSCSPRSSHLLCIQ